MEAHVQGVEALSWASSRVGKVRGGSRICGKGGGGAAAVPFEDPLWNFKGGGGAGGVRPL